MAWLPICRETGFIYWVFQTGCFAPGSTRNDWGTSRPCLFPPTAVKSKPPAMRVVVDSDNRIYDANSTPVFQHTFFDRSGRRVLRLYQY
jgi:hypothetical protein